MAAWGVCLLARSPAAQVAAWAAHHLAMGAARVWVLIDLPEGPADLPRHPRLTVIPCDAAFWGGARPPERARRQVTALSRVHAEGAALGWIAMLEVWEFLIPLTDDPATILDAVPPDRLVVQLAPWEAVPAADPAWRKVLPGPARARLRGIAFGPAAEALERGCLGSPRGKALIRTGLADVTPHPHEARRGGTLLSAGGFHPGLALLSTATAQWEALQEAQPQGPRFPFVLRAEFDEVQRLTPRRAAALEKGGALIRHDLRLPARIAEVFGETAPSRPADFPSQRAGALPLAFAEAPQPALTPRTAVPVVTWGLSTLVKAPADQILGFAAHHLGLGAARLWIHLDAPETPEAALARDWLRRDPRITVVDCTPDWWQAHRPDHGGRPPSHRTRQTLTMKHTLMGAETGFVGLIDVDEFLWPREGGEDPVGAALAALSPQDRTLRLLPWEALQESEPVDDIFAARHFRAALIGPERAELRLQVFGGLAPLLPRGTLSHSEGKCLFRTGDPELRPRLHGGYLGEDRLPRGPVAPGLALLHFHAEDRARWLSALPFRLERGAYQFNPALQVHLAACSEAAREAFFDAVQGADPATLRRLRDGDALISAELRLRAKVRAVFGPDAPGAA